MAGFFISDLRRALGSAGFFLACLITILIWVVSTLDLLPIPDETVLTIYENGNVGQMQILMPAVAALPYGTAFSDEWRSRYFRLQLLRGNVIEWLLFGGHFVRCAGRGLWRDSFCVARKLVAQHAATC